VQPDQMVKGKGTSEELLRHSRERRGREFLEVKLSLKPKEGIRLRRESEPQTRSKDERRIRPRAIFVTGKKSATGKKGIKRRKLKRH